jgi:hypothetical protein
LRTGRLVARSRLRPDRHPWLGKQYFLDTIAEYVFARKVSNPSQIAACFGRFELAMISPSTID